MNKRVKKMWVAALRSGKYKQTTGTLRKDDAFCCLGVLCDLYVQETGDVLEDGGRWCQMELPTDVYEWADTDVDPVLGKGSAVEHNDGIGAIKGKTFTQISNLIQRYL